jgi:hypothetical protein
MPKREKPLLPLESRSAATTIGTDREASSTEAALQFVDDLERWRHLYALKPVIADLPPEYVQPELLLPLIEGSTAWRGVMTGKPRAFADSVAAIFDALRYAVLAGDADALGRPRDWAIRYLDERGVDSPAGERSARTRALLSTVTKAIEECGIFSEDFWLEILHGVIVREPLMARSAFTLKRAIETEPKRTRLETIVHTKGPGHAAFSFLYACLRHAGLSKTDANNWLK